MKEQIISEKTLIPITGIAVVALVIYAFSRVEFKAESAIKEIEEVSRKQEVYSADIQEVKESLGEIKGSIKEMNRYKYESHSR